VNKKNISQKVVYLPRIYAEDTAHAKTTACPFYATFLIEKFDTTYTT
jgi:hypothetical protein